MGHLSGELTARYGRGFSRRNLEQMRTFYERSTRRRLCAAVGPSASSPGRSRPSSTSEPRSRRTRRRFTKGAKRKAADAVSAEEELKDPLVLEFLGLKDEYSESDIERGAHSSARAVPPRARRRFRFCWSTTTSTRRRRVVPDRPALLPSRAPLPRGHRPEDRRVHARGRRPDAPVPELRARTLDAPRREPARGSHSLRGEAKLIGAELAKTRRLLARR